MSKPAKIIIGLSVTLLCLGVIVFFFLRHLVTKSFPVTDGQVAVQGLRKPVDVYRDNYGVPHIFANDEHDLMFAAGYTHAQDRLWQMELTRRAGEGRLSEIFDTGTVKFDKLFRTLGFRALAETLELSLHPTSRRILQDYAEGVNAFIASHKGKYPAEFDMLDFEPEPWTVAHSLLVARLMAWELNFAWWADLTYAEIATLVSEEKFREILLSTSSSPPTKAAGKRPSQTRATPPVDSRTRAEIRGYLDLVRSYREYFQSGPFSAGSNAWVVSGARSLSRKPLLANDPHLRISVPAKWYEMHLAAPGWDASGVSIPGTPVIVIGHNPSLAWGMTNAMLDDADFYIERTDSLNPGRYLFRDSSRAMSRRDEVIRIGRTDSIEITVRATHHGPIVNDIHPRAQHHHTGMARHRSPLLSFRWSGFDVSDEIYGFYLLNRATNEREFEEGVSKLGVPAQCIVYADVMGNIGSWVGGRVPLRSPQADPTLPLEGWTGKAEWQGYVPFAELPKRWNPPEGMIINANQPFTTAEDRFPHYLTTLWEPSARYDRIRELLTATEQFTAEDFKRFQQDVTSLAGKELARHILAAYDDSASAALVEGNVPLQDALEYLRNWDYRCTPTDVATTIASVAFIKLLHNTLEDEMTGGIFDDFVFFSALPYRALSALLATDSSSWFDDTRTPGVVETKEEMIRLSVRHALDELTATSGSEMKRWQWGKLHEALFAHPFGQRVPLDRVFNVGPFPLGGSAATINKADFRISAPYRLYAGPSMRQIVDLASPQEAFMVLTLGQSGQALHPHYSDQTSLWLNGGYRTVTLRREEITSAPWEHLELVPE